MSLISLSNPEDFAILTCPRDLAFIGESTLPDAVSETLLIVLNNETGISIRVWEYLLLVLFLKELISVLIRVK